MMITEMLKSVEIEFGKRTKFLEGCLSEPLFEGYGYCHSVICKWR